MGSKSKPTIMVLVDWFEPGYKAGGPIRSCVNFVNAMINDYKIFILTSNTDLGENEPYSGIESDNWNNYKAGVEIYYLSKKNMDFFRIKKIIQEIKPNYIYINIIYSIPFSLYPLLLKMMGFHKSTIVICPRGMLNKHGLATKPTKKYFYLNILNILGAFKNVIFHATNNVEAADVKEILGANKTVITVPNFASSKFFNFSFLTKSKGELKLVYLARIHPIKNLLFLLKTMKASPSEIQLNIYGPIEDEQYWAECKTVIKDLEQEVKYCGEVSHNDVANVLSCHHFMVSPTTGENFGHTIFESFQQGRPVIIANTTPWKNLYKKKVGWDLSIENPKGFLTALNEGFIMEQEEYDTFCKKCWNLSKELIASPEILETYKKIFFDEKS